MLVLAVTLWPFDPHPVPGDEGIVLRGGPPMVSVQAADPVAERARYQAVLEQAGLQVQAATRPGRQVLDVDIPAQPSVAQLRALEELRLDKPQGPVLVIEFHTP